MKNPHETHKKKKTSHGGKRSGSGRRLLGRKPYMIRMLPEAHSALADIADSSGISIGQVVEGLALAAKKLPPA